MTRYQIEQTVTGVVLWEGEAASEDAALDAAARAAGYRDDAHAREVVGEDNGVVVREVPAEVRS